MLKRKRRDLERETGCLQLIRIQQFTAFRNHFRPWIGKRRPDKLSKCLFLPCRNNDLHRQLEMEIIQRMQPDGMIQMQMREQQINRF